MSPWPQPGLSLSPSLDDGEGCCTGGFGGAAATVGGEEVVVAGVVFGGGVDGVGVGAGVGGGGFGCEGVGVGGLGALPEPGDWVTGVRVADRVLVGNWLEDRRGVALARVRGVAGFDVRGGPAGAAGGTDAPGEMISGGATTTRAARSGSNAARQR